MDAVENQKDYSYNSSNKLPPNYNPLMLPFKTGFYLYIVYFIYIYIIYIIFLTRWLNFEMKYRKQCSGKLEKPSF